MHVGQHLNRFTDLPALLDILKHKRLTLLSPGRWEDRNDAYFVERYKEEKNLKTVLALCFTTKGERFHHWKIFASGPSGVCIEFDKQKLLERFTDLVGVRTDMVRYRKIDAVTSNKPPVEDWPFLKRIPFKDESEFRIIYEDEQNEYETKDFAFDLSAIRKVSLSPWLAKPVCSTLISVIASLEGCKGLTVEPSTLLQNEKWRNVIKNR